MIYLAHYEHRNPNGKKVREQQGIISAGNSIEALKKVCSMVGWPIRWEPKEVKHLSEESVFSQVDSDGYHHKIQVSHLDRMMTIKNKLEDKGVE